MRKVDKVTVLYDEAEDRLHLRAQDPAGAVKACWVTQRMANRLVRALVQRLAQEAIPGAIATEPAPPRLQALEQAAAQMQMPRVAPVKVEASTDASPALVNSLEIGRTRGGRHAIVFRWGVDQTVQLTLDSTRLRQWLGIVHGLYVKADWRVDGVWPAWFDAAKSAAKPGASGVLH